MRSPLSGPIATLLMFVPLVAIPLFAMFGTPQFSTATPATQAEDLKFASERDKPATRQAQPEGDLIGGVQVTDASAAPQTPPPAAPPARNDADPFADFVRPDGDARRADAATANRTLPPGRGPQHATADESNNVAADAPPKSPVATADLSSDDTRTPRPERETMTVADAATETPADRKRSKAATRMTSAFDADPQSPAGNRSATDAGKGPSDEAHGWKAAVARLNALGIREYQLQPGDRQGEFHFSCRFVSRSNPRVTRRFEAEAGEPLDAVEQVLQQIDDWRGRRKGAGAEVRTSTGESPSNATVMAPRDEVVPATGIDVSNR